MKKKLVASIMATVLSLSLFVGCGQGDSDTIKIGGIGPLTGGASTYGISVKNGAQLLIDEINEAGGINGKKVELLFEDDQADGQLGTQAFNKLVDKDGVHAILGCVTSGSTLAVAPKATEREIPMITPTATEPTITNIGGEYVFRGCFVDSFQGEILAKYATEDLKSKTAAVLYNAGSDYSQGIADSFKKDFESKGGKVAEYLSYNEGDTDFKAQLTKIKSKNIDVLILPDYYNTVGLIAKQARETGIDAQLLGGDGWESEKLTEIGKDAVDGALYVNHYYSGDTDENVKNFVESYKEKFGAEPDAFAALSYDTTKVLLKAIESAGSTDAKAIKEALAKTSLDSVTGHIEFNDERSAVKSASIIKVEGNKKTLVTKVESDK